MHPAPHEQPVWGRLRERRLRHPWRPEDLPDLRRHDGPRRQRRRDLCHPFVRPPLQSGVEEIELVNGAPAWVSVNLAQGIDSGHTSHRVMDDGFEPDVQFNDALDGWLVATTGGGNTQVDFFIYDPLFTQRIGPAAFSAPWVGGFALVGHADHHAVLSRSSTLNFDGSGNLILPADVLSGACWNGATTCGPNDPNNAGNGWDLRWSSFDLTVGGVVDGNAPWARLFNRSEIEHGGLPVTVVKGCERLQIAPSAVVSDLSNTPYSVDLAEFNAVPHRGAHSLPPPPSTARAGSLLAFSCRTPATQPRSGPWTASSSSPMTARTARRSRRRSGGATRAVPTCIGWVTTERTRALVLAAPRERVLLPVE